jgi:hypothetical protein
VNPAGGQLSTALAAISANISGDFVAQAQWQQGTAYGSLNKTYHSYTATNMSLFHAVTLFNTNSTVTPYKQLIAVTVSLGAGIVLGTAGGIGIGGGAMLLLATAFTTFGWLEWGWLLMAIVIMLGAYAYQARGQGGAN